MWIDKLQNVYKDYQEFCSYNDIYRISNRLLKKDPVTTEERIKLWISNPKIKGSVNPEDLAIVNFRKYKQVQS